MRSVLTCPVHSCPNMADTHDGYKKGSGSNTASKVERMALQKVGAFIGSVVESLQPRSRIGVSLSFVGAGLCLCLGTG